MELSIEDCATIEALTYNSYGIAIGLFEAMISRDFYKDRDQETRCNAQYFAREGIVYRDEIE